MTTKSRYTLSSWTRRDRLMKCSIVSAPSNFSIPVLYDLPVSWSEVSAIAGGDSSSASLEASTRAFIVGILARVVCELVGVGRVEIDLLALWDQIGLLLNGEHGLWTIRRHLAVGAKNCQLVLQCLHVEV